MLPDDFAIKKLVRKRFQATDIQQPIYLKGSKTTNTTIAPERDDVEDIKTKDTSVIRQSLDRYVSKDDRHVLSSKGKDIVGPGLTKQCQT